MSHRLANGARTSYTYDEADRLLRVGHVKSDNSHIATFNYTYDNVGNRTRVAEINGDVVTWAYDKASQLLVERRNGLLCAHPYHTTYTYDPVGNRLRQYADELTLYNYDAANRLEYSVTTSGRTTFLYDFDGNQSRIETPSGHLTTNTWDYENRNTQVVLPDDSVLTFVYDADDRRVSRSDELETLGFVWDDENLLAETDELGVPEAEYVYQPVPSPYWNLVSRYDGAESSFYHFDGIDSTAALTDSAEVITDEYSYLAFGKTLATSGTTDNPFQWIGGRR